MHEAHCFAHAGGSSPNLCTVQGNICRLAVLSAEISAIKTRKQSPKGFCDCREVVARAL